MTLLSLGIRPDTDPNDPSTWSDELKINHKRTLKALGPEAKKVLVKPQGSVSGKSAGFSPIESDTNMYGEAPESGILTGENVSQRDNKIQESLSSIDNSDLEKDAVPKHVDPEFWGSLSKGTKSNIRKFIKLHRDYIARYTKDGQLPTQDYIKRAGWNNTVATAYRNVRDTLKDVKSSIGVDSFKNGDRVDDSEYDIDTAGTAHQQERSKIQHQLELGRRKAVVHLMSNYPVGFSEDDEDPSELGVRKASEEELKNKPVAKSTPKSSPQSNRMSDEELDNMEEMDDYECDTCGEPAIGYDEENGYQCKSCYKDTHGSDDTQQDQEEPEEEPETEETASETNNEGASTGNNYVSADYKGFAEHQKAVSAIDKELSTHDKKSSGFAAVKALRDAVSPNGGPTFADTNEEERDRVTGIINQELAKHKKGSIMHASISRIADNLGYDLSSVTPTVQEQNQAQIEAGSNVSAQMTEAGAQSSKEDSQQQLKNAFGSITESLAGIHSIIKQSIMDGTEHIYPEANRISDAAATRILIQKGLAADWNEGHGIVKGLPRGTDGFQHSNMTILSEFNNYLNKNLSSQETSGNTSEEELEAAKPTEETGTSSYTGSGSVPTQPRATYQSGGSLSWKDSLDKFNEWRAAKKVTYKDNGPAIRKIAKEIRAKSPGVVGHLLDLDDKFSSLTNNQRLDEDDPRKELVNNLRAAAMSIHSHISDKASSSPNELATELPQSLRADHLLNETPTIAKGADVGQPDKIDPNLWVTLSPDQKKHVDKYIHLHNKVQSFQLPNGQIAGSDESLSAYNEMHEVRNRLEKSFGATAASKVGTEKYDVASKKVFDLLKEYPLGITRVF